MPDISLEQLKQLEKTIAKLIILKYGQNMPSNVVDDLNSTSVLNAPVISRINSTAEAQSVITRELFNKVINVKCEKAMNIDGVMIDIPYGEYLEKGLIEYYSSELAREYNIDLTEMPELKENLEMVKTLKEKLDSLDSVAFKENANMILSKANIEEIIKLNDQQALKEYLQAQALVAGNSASELNSQQLDKISETLEDKSRLQMVFLNGKRHLKYINKEGKVELAEVNDSMGLSNELREAFAALKPNEKLDTEKLFQRLKEQYKEVDLNSMDNMDLSQASSETIDMLGYIYSNEKIADRSHGDVITHSQDGSIHVIEATNEIDETKANDKNVEASIIKNDYTGLTMNGTQEDLQKSESNDERVITKEEYENISEKFAKGEKLSLDELRALKRYTDLNISQTDVLRDEEYIEMQKEALEEMKKDNMSLTKKSPYGYYGFAKKCLMIFILIMTSCIGLIIGALLFKLTH